MDGSRIGRVYPPCMLYQHAYTFQKYTLCEIRPFHDGEDDPIVTADSWISLAPCRINTQFQIHLNTIAPAFACKSIEACVALWFRGKWFRRPVSDAAIEWEDRRMVETRCSFEGGGRKKRKERKKERKEETRSYEFKIVASWREGIWKWDGWDIFGGENICDLVLEVRYTGGHASSVRTNGWCLPMRIRIILPAGLSILSLWTGPDFLGIEFVAWDHFC